MSKYEVYGNAFRRGVNDSKYIEDVESLVEPEDSEEDYAVMGYHDGFMHGIYLVNVGMRYAVSNDNYAAEIDRCLNNRNTKGRIK